MKYLYKVIKGRVETKIFELDDNPSGWSDSPEKAKLKAGKKKAKAPTSKEGAK